MLKSIQPTKDLSGIQVLTQLIGHTPDLLAYHFLKMVFKRAESGLVVIEQPANEDLNNSSRIMHGMFISGLLDIAAVSAIVSRLSKGKFSVTKKMITEFNAMAKIEQAPFEVTGTFVREDGKRLYARSEMKDKSGTLIASAEGEFRALDIP